MSLTNDHVILLKRLSHSFGVTSTAYSWIQSYLCGRTQSVCIGRRSSALTSCSVRVPQGSVLGLLLFSIYTSPIYTIAQTHHIERQQYADDTQLYVAMSPTSYSNDVNSLQQCLASLHVWFCENRMALNPSKSVATIFGMSQRVKSIPGSIPVNVASTVIPLSDRVKILGATLDSKLTMDNHTESVSKSCFYHIRSLRHIRSSVEDDMAVSVASAIVPSCLDYVNSILLGCPQKHIARLQRAQNTLARAVVQPQSRALPLSSSSRLLKQLHWLPIEIRFKLSTLTFKALHTGRPKYLTDLLHLHKPTRSMRSPYTQTLTVPRHNLSFGSCTFRISAPKNWNTLPLEVRQSILAHI